MTKVNLNVQVNTRDGQNIVGKLTPHCPQRYASSCVWPRCIGETDEKGYYDPCGCDSNSVCVQLNPAFVSDDADLAPLVEIFTPAELLDMGYVEVMGS